MFYTIPQYAISADVNFEEMGALPGTQVWRAVRLSAPKLWFFVQFESADSPGITETILCVEVPPVVDLVQNELTRSARIYACIPENARPDGKAAFSLVQRIEVGEFTDHRSATAPSVAYVIEAEDEWLYVDPPIISEKVLRNKKTVFEVAHSKEEVGSK